MPAAIAPAPAKTEPVSTPTPAPAPAPEKPASTPAHIDPSPESDPDFAAFEKQLNERDAQTEPKEKTADKPPEQKPAEKKTETAPAKQPTAKDDKGPKEPKELRAAYEKATSEAKALRESVAALEAKIAEGDLKGKDTAALSERLAAREKELEERDKTIRALKREQDPKFKEKWDAPFESAAETARRSIERLPIDNGDGTTRAAKFQDFIPFYRSAVAEGGVIDFDGLKEKFGDGFQVALTHLNNLVEKNDQRERALADENKRWQAEEQERTANEVKQREEMANLRTKAYKFVEEKNPEWFKENPDDAEGAELLKKGREFVSRQPKTPAETAVLQAEIYHRAAAHDLVLNRYEKVKAENEALRAENEELKASGPGATRRDGGGKAATGGDDWESLASEVRAAGAAD